MKARLYVNMSNMFSDMLFASLLNYPDAYVTIIDIMDDLIQTLKILGLTENEASLYLSCLEIGNASVLELSKHTGIKRPTTYITLFSLQEKGVVRELKQNGKLRYLAENPRVVINRQKNKIARLEKELPLLMGLASLNENKPKVRFYEGKEGVINIYEDNLLEPIGSELLAFTSAQDLYDLVGAYMDEHIARRVARNIKARTVVTQFDNFDLHFDHSAKELREMRALKHNDFPFSGEMNIYGNKVSIVSFGDQPIGLIIESQKVADNMRAIFELAWRGAKEIDKSASG